ncbi:MAG: hypothetical protein ACOX2N_00790 [Peptococcia bacterium]
MKISLSFSVLIIQVFATLKDGREYIYIVMGVPLKVIHNQGNAQLDNNYLFYKKRSYIR